MAKTRVERSAIIDPDIGFLVQENNRLKEENAKLELKLMAMQDYQMLYETYSDKFFVAKEEIRRLNELVQQLRQQLKGE